MSRDYSSRRSSAPGMASGSRSNRQRPDSARRNTRHSRQSAPHASRRRGGNTRHDSRSQQATPDRRVWVICAVLLALIGLCLYFISQPTSHEDDNNATDIQLPEAQAQETRDSDKSDESDSADSTSAGDKTETRDKSTEREKDEAADQEPRFSFYKMLPNYRVQVEEEAQTPTPVARAQTPHEPEVSSKTPVPGESGQPKSSAGQTSNPADADADGQFRIQVGAFSRAEDAQRRRQELSELGVPAQVQSMQTEDGKTIYRVQSDRLDSRVQARSMSQKLENHGIETMIQRLAADTD